MKAYWLLGLGLICGLTACPTSPDISGFFGNSPSISGKITDLTAGKTGKVRMKLNGPNSSAPGASVNVSADGSFSNLVFLAPTDSQLSAFTIGGCPLVTTTPSDTKYIASAFEILNSSDALAGAVFESNVKPPLSNPTPVGTKYAVRIYVDKDSSVKGTCTAAGSQVTVNYNMNLKAGWNVVVATQLTSTSGEYITASIPSDVKFYFIPSGAPLLTPLFGQN